MHDGYFLVQLNDSWLPSVYTTEKSRLLRKARRFVVEERQVMAMILVMNHDTQTICSRFFFPAVINIMHGALHMHVHHRHIMTSVLRLRLLF